MDKKQFEEKFKKQLSKKGSVIIRLKHGYGNELYVTSYDSSSYPTIHFFYLKEYIGGANISDIQDIFGGEHPYEE